MAIFAVSTDFSATVGDDIKRTRYIYNGDVELVSRSAITILKLDMICVSIGLVSALHALCG